MTDSLRARIADAYHSVQTTDYKFTTDRAVIARDVANGRIDAMLAALGGVDSDEVAEVLTEGIESGDIDRAVRDIKAFYHLVRKEHDRG